MSNDRTVCHTYLQNNSNDMYRKCTSLIYGFTTLNAPDLIRKCTSPLLTSQLTKPTMIDLLPHRKA